MTSPRGTAAAGTAFEDAGYVEVRKGAVGRRPRTWFRLTAAGRQAVQGHLAWLAQLEEAVSARTWEEQQATPQPGDRDEPSRDQPRRVLPPLLGSAGPIPVVPDGHAGSSERQAAHRRVMMSG